MGHHTSKQHQLTDDQQMMTNSDQKQQHQLPIVPVSIAKAANSSLSSHSRSKLISEKSSKFKKSETAASGPASKALRRAHKNNKTGSVVITIRLLKMETSKNAENVEKPTDELNITASIDFSNNNCSVAQPLANQLTNDSKASTSIDTSKTAINGVNSNESNKVLSETDKFLMNNQIGVGSKNNKSMNNNAMAESGEGSYSENNNSEQNQMNIDLNNINNNYGVDEDRSNSNNSLKQSNSASPNEAQICDKKQNNTSASQSETIAPIKMLTKAMESSSISPVKALTLSTNHANKVQAVKLSDKQTLEAAHNFISSNIIKNVSPYPHHIPIANLMHPDSVSNTATADECTSQHQHKNIQNDISKSSCTKDGAKETKAKKANWIKFNCPKLKSTKSHTTSTPSELPMLTLPTESNANTGSASSSNVSSPQPTTLVLDKSTLFGASGGNVIVVTMDQHQPLLDFSRFNPDDYPIEDCDKKARLQRALEIAEGVEPPPGFISTSSLRSLHSMSTSSLQLLSNSPIPQTNDTSPTANVTVPASKSALPSHWHMVCSNNAALRLMLPSILHHPEDIPRIHSQVDYIHCLVPDLKQITNCSFYWGKMDRYEAERLLENKPEGTFLLRDSAQEEFLFSVSFRKYGRSLHARIEQFNHKFSFDCHDPNVYTSTTVTGLLEHYKDPACVMFFEPALTLPLNRSFVFSLQQLCRATIVSHTTYDGINDLCLPNKLKSYLKEYHYKQRVRVKRFDDPLYGTA